MMQVLTQQQKNKIKNYLRNLPEMEWHYFKNHTQLEAAYILMIIQNQKGSTLETDGVSYKEETHTKFRRINTTYTKLS